MKLIAVISHKGGAGKTTTAVQLAEELARRGKRTLLVDADRQQGAGMLLGIDTPAGCVQRTTQSNLEYLGSARLTDLEVADCYASVDSRFDIGVVDTPSLDDALARAWLREAAATLMVLQVDPLTVKTLPSALNTLEVVRAFKPSIQLLGLLPTMFDQDETNHRNLLAELLSRRPEAVFMPVVPVDSGLMHRANPEERPPIGETVLQAYQCAVDRILRSLEGTGTVSAARPKQSARQGGVSQEQSLASPVPPPAAVPAARKAPWAQPQSAPAPKAAAPSPAAASPGGARPPMTARPQDATPAPGGWAGAPEPRGARQAVQRPAQSPAQRPTGPGQSWSAPQGSMAAPQQPLSPQAAGSDPRYPMAADMAHPTWQDDTEPAMEMQSPVPAGVPLQPRLVMRGTARPRGRLVSTSDPDWWRQHSAQVDVHGVARRTEPWLVRARFAIACTIACLALIAAVILGTVRRVSIDVDNRPVRAPRAPAAYAEETQNKKDVRDDTGEKAARKPTRTDSEERAPRKTGKKAPRSTDNLESGDN